MEGARRRKGGPSSGARRLGESKMCVMPAESRGETPADDTLFESIQKDVRTAFDRDGTHNFQSDGHCSVCVQCEANRLSRCFDRIVGV